MSAKPVTNWREKHKLIKEWKQKKKLKQKQRTDALATDGQTSQTTVVDNGVKTVDRDQHPMDTSVDDMRAPVASEGSSCGRKWTASIAVPFSIVDNAQSPELKAYLCGQIARALVVFNVDEIVVFDEYSRQTSGVDESSDESLLYDKRKSAMIQMIRVLQYLECPQYLRKYLFSIQKDLQFAGLLNPLDSIHHLKTSDVCQYREGVVTNRPVREGKGSYVYIGLQRDVQIDKCLKPNIRLTVRLDDTGGNKKLKGVAVSPSEPREVSGLYWGYTIRAAKSLSAVFTESPFPGGYDLTIGTSDRGQCVDSALRQLPKRFDHLLVVFGGLKGLEAAHDSDE
ncbi:unnamed protein product, partial [Oppiella nova]